MHLEDTIVVEGERKLHPNRQPDPERRPERVGRQLGRRGVRRALRLSNDQAAGQKLDRLVLVEDPQLDQPVVLPPRPPAGAEGRLADRARH